MNNLIEHEKILLNAPAYLTDAGVLVFSEAITTERLLVIKTSLQFCSAILPPRLIMSCSRRNFVCVKTALLTARTAEIHRKTDLGASLGHRNFQSKKKSRLESNSRSFALQGGPDSFF